MKKLSQFSGNHIKVLFSDIDDTMTTNGLLGLDAYQALWDLSKQGILVVPVTGRPAGWCEMICRFWPVAGVIGENGGFYFRYLHTEKKMKRYFSIAEKERIEHRRQLDKIEKMIFAEVPEAAISSDQFTRLCDLAIDYCEDIPPLSPGAVAKIVTIFESHGAQAKVSSIHVNGWFGNYNKLSTCQEFCRQELDWELKDHLDQVAFIGDSPNDEPMFEYFKFSFAVANIHRFADQISHLPTYVTPSSGGAGFFELAQTLIRCRHNTDAF